MDGGAGETSLAALRRAAGFTQEELAELSGLTVRAISNLERGVITRARSATLESLAKALGLTGEVRAQFISEHRRFPGSGASRQGSTQPSSLARQLPARAHGFAGRDAELATLIAALTDREEGSPALITGLGGIGKTALAVESAARLGLTFPGGQLYAKLASSEGAHRDPGRVLGEFLRALGVPPRSIPASNSERSRLWRSVTAESPVLLLLDDAASESQVRPLLPSGASRVLITSRRALGGLDTGTRIRLGPITSDAARLMLDPLKSAAGGAASDALNRLVQVCAGMPLALRLIAARMELAPHIPFDAMVDRLARELTLDSLSSGDRRVANTIAASVHALEPITLATVSDLALLGLPTVADWHLAALSGLSHSAATRMADDLVASGLLDAVSTASGEVRYSLHDLVRAYLREHGDQLRADALEQLVAWSVHLQLASLDTAIARPVPHVLWPPRPLGLTTAVASQFLRDAEHWFEAEYLSLTALLEACVGLERPREAGALLAAVRQPMTRAGLLEELIAAAGACAAISGDDPLANACAQLVSGSALAELGRYDDALRTITDALPDLESADVCTVAGAWYEVGWLHHQDRGHADVDSAAAAYRRSIELHRSIGNVYGELGGLCGLVELLQTDPEASAEASEYAQQALSLVADFADYRTVIKVSLTVWRSLTPALGDRVETLTEALRLARGNLDVPLMVQCLTALSAVLREAGRPDEALDAAREAVQLAENLRRPAELNAARAELEQVQRLANERDRGGRPATVVAR